jgi:hypothetical protein
MSTLLSHEWATQILIAQLVVADTQALVRAQKGKAPLGKPLSDGELALNEQLHTARCRLTYLEDCSVAQSLAQALHLDQDQLDAFSSINQGEQDDHLAALALSQGECLPAPTSSQQFLSKGKSTSHSHADETL